MKSKAGFSIAEVLVGTALLGIAGTVFFNLNFQITKATQIFNIQNAVQNLSTTARLWIDSTENWEVTLQRNQAMSCLRTTPNTCQTGATGVIDLYDKAGNILIGSTNRNLGFTGDGKACDSFGSPTSDCNFRAIIRWEIRCPAGSSACMPYEELISLEFEGKKEIQEFANISKYNLNRFVRGGFENAKNPLAVCARSNSLYVGAGKQITAMNGVTYNANSFGCVSFAAFKGRVGDVGLQGPQGPMGPMGPMGPVGPPGNVIFLPPPPTPTTTPTVVVTATPTVVPTVVPTATPTAAPIPTPTPTLASCGPFSTTVTCSVRLMCDPSQSSTFYASYYAAAPGRVFNTTTSSYSASVNISGVQGNTVAVSSGNVSIGGGFSALNIGGSYTCQSNGAWSGGISCSADNYMWERWYWCYEDESSQ